MSLERIFSETGRELAEGDAKCFHVIPAETKAIKFATSDASKISHIEVGGGRINIDTCPVEGEFIVVNLTVNAKFFYIVLSDTYLSTCDKKKYIIGKKKSSDGQSEFDDRVEVDIAETDITVKNDDTFIGSEFKAIISAILPGIRFVPK
jgi:hypothetical protein